MLALLDGGIGSPGTRAGCRCEVTHWMQSNSEGMDEWKGVEWGEGDWLGEECKSEERLGREWVGRE